MNQAKPYKDRVQAGKQLAKALRSVVHEPGALVLALPRGGVPVAHAVADALHLPLDIMLVRKIGMPGQEEYAIGALGAGGVTVLRRDVIEEHHISESQIEVLCDGARRELQRRQRHYRGSRAPPELAGRTLILVDDGIATGASMRAALEIARAGQAGRIIVAAPVGAPDTCEALRPYADELICPLQPASFSAVGQWYRHFDQTSDDEVVDLLTLAWRSHDRDQAA